MIAEGRGAVAPSPEVVRLNEGDFVAMRNAAESRTEFRGYAQRWDAWGRGLGEDIGPLPSHASSIFVGMAGEIACARYINLRLGRVLCWVDTRLSIRGDGGVDLNPNGYPIQVKTARGWFDCGLVRSVDAPGVGRHDPHAFVFAAWPGGIEVTLLGWATRDKVRRSPVRFAKKGTHENYEVSLRDMQPMCSLVDVIDAAGMRAARRAEASGWR